MVPRRKLLPIAAVPGRLEGPAPGGEGLSRRAIPKKGDFRRDRLRLVSPRACFRMAATDFPKSPQEWIRPISSMRRERPETNPEERPRIFPTGDRRNPNRREKTPLRTWSCRLRMKVEPSKNYSQTEVFCSRRNLLGKALSAAQGFSQRRGGCLFRATIFCKEANHA